MNNLRLQAFTVLELSMALLIISFITILITYGKTMVKAASFRSVMYDFNTFESAVQSFKLQYNGLPGDITNASSYWPSCDATPANCNGNGDGIITLNTSSLANEGYRFWQQLSVSGFITGVYSGTGTIVGGATTYQANIGTTTPTSKWIVNAGYLAQYQNSTTYNYYSPVVIFLGGFITKHENYAPTMSSFDAYNFDLKYDDGNAFGGKIMAANGFNSSYVQYNNCVYSSTDPVAYCCPFYRIGTIL